MTLGWVKAGISFLIVYCLASSARASVRDVITDVVENFRQGAQCRAAVKGARDFRHLPDAATARNAFRELRSAIFHLTHGNTVITRPSETAELLEIARKTLRQGLSSIQRLLGQTRVIFQGLTNFPDSAFEILAAPDAHEPWTLRVNFSESEPPVDIHIPRQADDPTSLPMGELRQRAAVRFQFALREAEALHEIFTSLYTKIENLRQIATFDIAVRNSLQTAWHLLEMHTVRLADSGGFSPESRVDAVEIPDIGALSQRLRLAGDFSSRLVALSMALESVSTAPTPESKRGMLVAYERMAERAFQYFETAYSVYAPQLLRAIQDGQYDIEGGSNGRVARIRMGGDVENVAIPGDGEAAHHLLNTAHAFWKYSGNMAALCRMLKIRTALLQTELRPENLEEGTRGLETMIRTVQNYTGPSVLSLYRLNRDFSDQFGVLERGFYAAGNLPAAEAALDQLRRGGPPRVVPGSSEETAQLFVSVNDGSVTARGSNRVIALRRGDGIVLRDPSFELRSGVFTRSMRIRRIGTAQGGVPTVEVDEVILDQNTGRLRVIRHVISETDVTGIQPDEQAADFVERVRRGAIPLGGNPPAGPLALPSLSPQQGRRVN